MRSSVIVFPGSNCDRDVQVALHKSFGQPPVMVWHGDTELPGTDLIVVPGGFSYGDYLRPGCMAAQSPAIKEVVNMAKCGVPVLGICNGFQILCETGLLPGALMRNQGLKFVCRDVNLRVENAETAFTRGYAQGQTLRIPIAHHDGNYTADIETLKILKTENLIAFRYCDEQGKTSSESNPNGSDENIAGILNHSRNVLGMMPHPERLADPTLGGTDGRIMFDSLATELTS